jgi:hypothetical protein
VSTSLWSDLRKKGRFFSFSGPAATVGRGKSNEESWVVSALFAGHSGLEKFGAEIGSEMKIVLGKQEFV